MPSDPIDVRRAIAERTARVAVVGQGYVGLVVAMRASEAGFDVVGLESDPVRAKQLASGTSYIEDVPDDVLAAALDRGYRPTDDPAALADVDVVVISVPTPLRDRLPDLSFVESAGATVARHLRPGTLVVLESTTYPGTTQELLAPILETGSGLQVGDDLLLGYSPERIDPGNTTYDLRRTPKIVSGVDDASLEAVDAFFSTFVEETVRVSGPREAELAKIVENTFRHVNIALVNEIAMFAHALGVDANEALDAAATKPFGFMRFTPGPGVGGHCLPIDPTYLSWRVEQDIGERFRFIDLANDVNEHMPRYVVRRVTELLNRDRLAVNGARVAVYGISYKPDVGDIREAPGLDVVEQLHGLGAEVVVVDPHVAAAPLPSEVVLRDRLSGPELGELDLLVLVCDHSAFDYDELVATAPRILDCRARLASAPHVERL